MSSCEVKTEVSVFLRPLVSIIFNVIAFITLSCFYQLDLSHVIAFLIGATSLTFSKFQNKD